MWNPWKSLKQKFLTDRADSILVPALILAPVLALSVGLAVEVQKNSYVRTERTNAIQDAASSAVSLADSRGSLNWSVVDKIVNEYEHNRFGGKKFSATSNSKLQYDGGLGKETAESTVFDGSGDSCLVGSEGEQYPQYRITLEEGRGTNSESAKTVTFNRTQPSTAQLNSTNRLNAVDADGKPVIYRAVRVQVIDQTPNILLGMAGMPCQKFDLTASAVTFAADADIE